MVTTTKQFKPERAVIKLWDDFIRKIGEAKDEAEWVPFIENYGYGVVTSIVPSASVCIVYRLHFHNDEVFKASSASIRAKVPGFGQGQGAWEELVRTHGKHFHVERVAVQLGANEKSNILGQLSALKSDDPDKLIATAEKALNASQREHAVIESYTVRPWTMLSAEAFKNNKGLRDAINAAPLLRPGFERALYDVALRRVELAEQREVAKILGLPQDSIDQAERAIRQYEQRLTPYKPAEQLPKPHHLVIPREKIIGKISWVLTRQDGRDSDALGYRDFRVNCMPEFTLPHVQVIEWVAIRYNGLALFDASDDSLFVKFGGIHHPHPRKELPPRNASRFVALHRLQPGTPLTGTGPIDVRLDMPFNWLVQIHPDAYSKAGKYGNKEPATDLTWKAVREGMVKAQGKVIIKVRGSEQPIEVELPAVPQDLKVIQR